MNRRHLLAAGAGLALTGLAGGPAQAQAKTMIIQIDGAAVPFYAPLYVAEKQGMFAKRGIQPQFVYAAASDILRNVAAGSVQLGFPNGDAVIAARASGLPVKVVHTTYQRGIGATIFKASSGIRTMADLKGKKVAVTALGSPNYLQLEVGLKQAGLTINDVQVEVIATGAIVQAVQAGTVDAMVFSELRRYNLEAAGVEVGVIQSNDFLPSFGNVVVAGEALLKSDPKSVRAFTDALDEALTWIIAGNTEAALKIAIDDYAPTWKGQEEMLAKIFNGSFIPTIWQSGFTKQNGLGYGNLAGWQKNIDILAENKVIDQSFEAVDLVVQPSSIGG